MNLVHHSTNFAINANKIWRLGNYKDSIIFKWARIYHSDCNITTGKCIVSQGFFVSIKVNYAMANNPDS